MKFANRKLFPFAPATAALTAAASRQNVFPRIATTNGSQCRLAIMRRKMRRWPMRSVAVFLVAISFLLVGIRKSRAQNWGSAQSLTIVNIGGDESGSIPSVDPGTILSLNTMFAYDPNGNIIGLEVRPGSFYVGPDGQAHPITKLGQSMNLYPFELNEIYSFSGACGLAPYPNAPANLGGPGTFSGVGLGVSFSFGGNTQIHWYTNSSYPFNEIVPATLSAFATSPANVSDDSEFFLSTIGGSGVVSAYENGVVPNDDPTGPSNSCSGDAYGYVSTGNGILNMFVFSTLAESAGFDSLNGDLIEASAGFSGVFWVGRQTGDTNTYWTPTLAATVISGSPGSGSGQAASGGVGSLPSGIAYPANSALPIYYFSNLLSGASCGVPSFGQADYAYSLQTLDGSLIQTLTLPTNWNGSVTVSVSNSVLGSFQPGQTVSLTSFPGGGVGQVSIVGSGSPLYISGAGFPIALTFNTNESTLALKPLFLQVSFPSFDQTVSAGNQLTVPLSVQSDLSLSYQWQLNGTDVAGQTNAILTIPSAGGDSAGTYMAAITTSGNGTNQIWYSPAANVTVQTAVQFTASPTNGDTPLTVQFDCPGVDSLGSNIVAWEWDFGDGTTSTQQNPSHTYLTAGTFSPALVATNDIGFTVIGSGPTVTTVAVGPTWTFDNSNSATFIPSSSFDNNPTVPNFRFNYGSANSSAAFQWTSQDANDNPNSGSIEASLTLNENLDGGASKGAFAIDVAGGNGLSASELSFDLMIAPGSAIDQYGGYGDLGIATLTSGWSTFNSVWDGPSPETNYEFGPYWGVPYTAGTWYHFDIPLSGSAATNINAINIQDYDGGSKIINGTINFFIDNLRLTGAMQAPAISSQPAGLTNLIGTTASFSVIASGTSPLNYQWMLNETNLSDNGHINGSQTAVLTISNIQSIDAGNYSVEINNSAGSTNSAGATLTVVTPRIDNIAMNIDGSVTLEFSGLPNATTRIWATTNLAAAEDWQPIFTNTITSTNGTWQFSITNSLGTPTRFYRFSTP